MTAYRNLKACSVCVSSPLSLKSLPLFCTYWSLMFLPRAFLLLKYGNRMELEALHLWRPHISAPSLHTRTNKFSMFCFPRSFECFSRWQMPAAHFFMACGPFDALPLQSSTQWFMRVVHNNSINSSFARRGGKSARRCEWKMINDSGVFCSI